MKVGRATIASIPVDRPQPTFAHPQGMCMDKGYDYEEVRETVREFGFPAPLRNRGAEAQALKREASFKARRWVVERGHSWMNRFRRGLMRWDKSAANYLAFLHFACALIAFRAAGLFGEALSIAESPLDAPVPLVLQTCSAQLQLMRKSSVSGVGLSFSYLCWPD